MKEVSTLYPDYARRDYAYLDDDDHWLSTRCTFLLTMAILTRVTMAKLTMAILTMAILTRVTSTARSRRPPSPPYAAQGSNQGLVDPRICHAGLGPRTRKLVNQ